MLTVCRYVERNALTARLVDRAEQWPWSSLAVREQGPVEAQQILHNWPVARPADWVERVNRPISESELARLRTSVSRSQPLGDAAWTSRTAEKLNLEHTLRKQGRPPKPASHPERIKTQPTRRNKN